MNIKNRLQTLCTSSLLDYLKRIWHIKTSINKQQKSMTRGKNLIRLEILTFPRMYLHGKEITWWRNSIYHMTARHTAHRITWGLMNKWDLDAAAEWGPTWVDRLLTALWVGKMNYNDDHDTEMAKDKLLGHICIAWSKVQNEILFWLLPCETPFI